MNPFIFTGCTNYPRLSEKIQLYSSSTVHKKSFSIRFKNLRNYYLLHLFNCQYMSLLVVKQITSNGIQQVHGSTVLFF